MIEKSFSSVPRLAAAIRSVLQIARKAVGARRRQRHGEVELIEESSLFDRDWYLRTYPDVARAGVDPADHYLDIGWREDRDPGPEFATSAYLKANADVARLGVNPLLHFIKFGHAEGRGTFAHRQLLRTRAALSFDFARPHPCLSLPIQSAPPVVWQRTYRLDRERPECFTRDGLAVGYVADPLVGASVEAAFAVLEILCGGGSETLVASPELPKSKQQLLDAWYVTSSQLRVRWDAKERPFVLRAFQQDPVCGAKLVLVGEGLISTRLDVIDLHLMNAYFPILFIIAQPDGTLSGARIMAFPSLCRGGIHYPEMLGTSASERGNGKLDSLSHGETLAENLLRFARGKVQPAISAIEVDLEGTDGTGPLFQSDFRLWLEKVAQVAVAAAQSPNASPSERFLSEMVAICPAQHRERHGATLVLASDMVPTIASLTLIQRVEAADSNRIILPFLIASEPVILVELPRQMATIRSGPANLHQWPHLSTNDSMGLSRPFPTGAIQMRRRKPLTDAELLVPHAAVDFAGLPDCSRAVTWLINAAGAQPDQLAQTMAALALQRGAAGDSVAFVGDADRQALSIAELRFQDRVAAFGHFLEAVRTVDTPLMGFIAPGVILHDERTSDLFAWLLKEDSVASISCVRISADRRGKSWHLTIEDPLGEAQSRLAPNERMIVAEQVWRSTYPVAQPADDLWVARCSTVEAWLQATGTVESGVGTHLLTSLVTASSAGNLPGQAASLLPNRPSATAAQFEVFVG
jgi:hypothetical protein